MKKLIYILTVLLPFLIQAQAQIPTQDKNYVLTYTYNNSNTISSYSAPVDTTAAKINITYLDGLGRPVQQIAARASGEGKDIITHVEYDANGRQAKKYLPYASEGYNFQYDSSALMNTQNFYDTPKYENTTNPYSETFFEGSPLDRITKQSAPGNDWRANIDDDNNVDNDGDHTVKFKYSLNKAKEVRFFSVHFKNLNGNEDTEKPSLSFNPLKLDYPANQLYKIITKDENWTPADGKNKTTEEFKDKLGRLILKRNYNEGLPHDTYYVYDKFSNLTYVIPPLAADKIIKQRIVIVPGNPPFSQDQFKIIKEVDIDKLYGLCYIYHYDSRNRVVEKHIPGAGWTHIVYDKLDRPVLTQDENLRVEGKWLFTKYDRMGRVAYTGEYTSPTAEKRGDIKTAIANSGFFETRVSYSFTSGGTDINYSNKIFPKNNIEVLTVTYYDDYDFEKSGITLPTPPPHPAYTTATKGLATGSKVRVLDGILTDDTTSNWIVSVSAYDEKARPTWTHTKNHYLDTQDIIKTGFDFIGRVGGTTKYHNRGTLPELVVYNSFRYDNQDRLLLHKQSETPQSGWDIGAYQHIIAQNKYDELGRLNQKRVGGKGGGYSNEHRLQTVDYTYNIRGWLNKINDPEALLTDDLFAFKINYNTTEEEDAVALYNGNISETFWKSKTDNKKRGYFYIYDDLNHLNTAQYKGGYELVNYPGEIEDYTTEAIQYDKNGNLIQLLRRGLSSVGTIGEIDHILYEYLPNSNQLKLVKDIADGNAGFKNGATGTTTTQDYRYDANGNMLKDLNKGIGVIAENEVKYNHLNLPMEINFSGNQSGRINYIYDSTGNKLQKKVNDNGNVIVKDYANGFIYENNGNGAVLKFFTHPEGYAKVPEPSFHGNDGERYNPDEFEYVYQYKDHLGNVRLSYSDEDDNGYINDVLPVIFEDGFENGSGWSDATGWSEWPNTGWFLSEYDTSKKHSGTYSGKIYNPESTEKYIHSDQWISINNNEATEYTFSCWVYSNGPISEMFLFMKEYGEQGYYTSISNTATAAKGYWKKLSKTVTVPANIKKLNIRIDNNGGGTVWFDDVKIKKGNNTGASEILEENNYYAFGMKHKGYHITNVTDPALKYKYNGKELQDELGLNWYDYQARNYDPAIGRWFNVDPLAETSRRYSPYTYALDNPIYFIDPDGMKGEDWIKWSNKEGEKFITYDSGVKTISQAETKGYTKVEEVFETGIGTSDLGETFDFRKGGIFSANGGRFQSVKGGGYTTKGGTKINGNKSYTQQLAAIFSGIGDFTAYGAAISTASGVGAPLGAILGEVSMITGGIGTGLELLDDIYNSETVNTDNPEKLITKVVTTLVIPNLTKKAGFNNIEEQIIDILLMEGESAIDNGRDNLIGPYSIDEDEE